MSPSMKLSVLALAGAAAAIPQYGHGYNHGQAHRYYSLNTTSVAASSSVPVPIGTGASTPVAITGTAPGYQVGGPSSSPVVGASSSKPASSKSTPAGSNSTPAGHQSHPVGGSSSVPAGGVSTPAGAHSTPAAHKTTTVYSYETAPASGEGYGEGQGEGEYDDSWTITSTITKTVYKTINTSTAQPTKVGVQDVSDNDEGAHCGGTVYVTATEKVYVTVPAGGAATPSSAPASSPAPVASGSAPGYQVPAPRPSSSKAPVVPETPASSASSASFVLASSSTVEKPVEKPTSAPYVQEASSTAPASSSAAPSATPSSPPTSGYTGGKRGLAYRWDGAADCKSFESDNFGFIWNWEADTKGDVGSLAGKFIPTLRTMANAGDWADKVETAIKGGSKVVFGLNEPDIGSQANLDVGSLCSAWKDNMNPIAEKHSDVTIVGPSVSSSQNKGQGLDYLSNFIQACPEAKFSDINLHWYGPASAGFDGFKAHFDDAVSKFPGRKIWVTEFALEQGASVEDSVKFVKDASKYLDGHASCAGYSYFAVGNFDPSYNLLGSKSALTEVGKAYVN